MISPSNSHPKFINTPYSYLKEREKKQTLRSRKENRKEFNDPIPKHWTEEAVGSNLDKTPRKVRISSTEVSVSLTFKEILKRNIDCRKPNTLLLQLLNVNKEQTD